MAETIASAIRSDSLIDGFALPGQRRIKLCQYADDTSLIIMSDAAVKQVFALFHRYELASGAKLNVLKSHGLLVGLWTSRTNLPIALDWSSQSITIMGAILSNLRSDESWHSPVQQLDKVLASWSQRKLSFHGRALIANTLGLSLFWYLGSFLVMPSNVIAAINSRIFPFVWQRKREWLSRASITQRPGQGGLVMSNV